MKTYILALAVALAAASVQAQDCGNRAGGGLLRKRDHSAFLNQKPAPAPARTAKAKGSN